MSWIGIEDRVTVVTGAAQGIGAAVARTLGARGARVAAVDSNSDGLDRLVADLGRRGIEAAGYRADVRDRAQVELAVKKIESDLGPVGILVNVAGVLRTGAVTDLTDEDWAEVFRVNTDGVFHFSQVIARGMVRRRSGAIVTVSSNAARVPRTRMAAYAASKAATSMFTKCLGLELAAYGIRCNVVSPGSTDTPMQRRMWTDEGGRQRVIDGDPAAYRTGIPLRKLATPDDVARAVAFLASEEAGHITMHELYVDGGAA